MNKITSLKKRIVWYVVSTSFLMSILTGLGVYYGTSHEADEILNASLIQTSRVLDGLMSRQTIATNGHQLQLALQRATTKKGSKDKDNYKENESKAYEKKLFFEIRDNNNNLLLSSKFSPNKQSTSLKQGFSARHLNNKKWVTYTLKSHTNELWIIVGERSDVREEIGAYISNALLLPLIFILPFILFFLWHLVGIALKPLNTVVNQVLQQDINHLKKVTVENIPKEIEPLLIALNKMVEKLEISYQREKRFVSDASHELRNPLAALLINIDNALEENNDSDVAESLSSMKLSIKQLTHLVSQLFTLSHSENPLETYDFKAINLTQLCQQSAQNYRTLSDKKEITLMLNLSDKSQTIWGVESLLSSLINNLLDNAIKYSPRSCSIKLSCEQIDNSIRISVDDSGDGLSQEMQKQVVKRFFRVDKNSTSGAGLGLSIVKTITELHQATLHISDSSLGGLRVCINFIKINDITEPHRI